tara:strand:- start:2541 stop:2936 length:396 start_codon:yes stop_codon:yes gene_type:complete
MKAKIARIQIDIDYKCPNCYLHFRLSNSKIPRNKQSTYSCPECRELLSIPTIFSKTNQTASFTNSSPKNNLPIKKNIDSIRERAKAAIRSQGYTASEATQLINNSYYQGISIADLIKDAIKNDKRITPNTA